jgi:hypothetical protein
LNPQHPDLESDALPLELLACIIQPFKHLIFSESNRPHCKKSDYKRGCSLGLFVHCMLSAKSAILAEFQLIRCCTFVFGCCIISSFAFITCKGNDYSHEQTPSAITLLHYAIISLTTPAPTVRPPSRMANLNSFSIAIGVINSAVIVTLSPGITISTPSGNVKFPVTSVVRK